MATLKGAESDPRRFLQEHGVEAFCRKLADEGAYLVQQKLIGPLSDSFVTGDPLLIEGVPGAGKTALAEAVASAFGMRVFRLQGTKGLSLNDVLYRWDEAAQGQWVAQCMQIAQAATDALGAELAAVLAQAREKACAEQWGLNFLKLGEAAAAFECARTASRRPLLIVDEVDKFDSEVHDMLLQLFNGGVMSAPRYGDIGTPDRGRWPVIFVTSNNHHPVDKAFKSRCIYVALDPPTKLEEVKILKLQVPDAPLSLVAQIVRMLADLRFLPGFICLPGIRQAVRLARVLTHNGVVVLTPDVLRRHACLLMQERTDVKNLEESIGYLMHRLEVEDEEITTEFLAQFSAA